MSTENTPSKKTLLAAMATGYREALAAHLAANAPRGEAARVQGRRALALGLLSRDLVVVHERALAAMLRARDFDGANLRALNRAGRFLTFALAPLEAALRAAREANSSLRQRNETLRLHALELARGKRRLQLEVRRSEAGEAGLIAAKERYRALFQESLLMQKKLRQLTRRMLSAQEDERKRISRELHDGVVQTLVGINIELTALRQSTTRGPKLCKVALIRAQRQVVKSVNAVHRFARELRPAVLDDLGLIPALHSFGRTLAAREKLDVQISAIKGVEALSAAKRTVIFRVVQEALTNAARHAKGTTVKLVIDRIPGAIRIQIVDNGCGFAAETVFKARNPKRLGLVGMRERIEMIGGRFALDSTPGKGTTVCVEIPFREVNPKSP